MSTREQNADGQHDALTGPGCERIVVDTRVGEARPAAGVDRCLEQLGHGDEPS